MTRLPRTAPGGIIYHVFNHANASLRLFRTKSDYANFERIMCVTLEKTPMRLLGYILLPSHWRLILWPKHDRDMGNFMQRLSTTHVRQWHNERGTSGHLYQGNYKFFPVAPDEHLLAILRFIEQNALRDNLVKRAEDWQWSSLWRWLHPEIIDDVPLLAKWPVDRPRQWLNMVNRIEKEAKLEDLRTSLVRGRPFGDPVWQFRIAKQLGLEPTFNPRGRPKKS